MIVNRHAESLDLPVPGGGNAPVLTVSDIAAAVKRTVEETFGRVRVRGEICEFKVAGSGHAYLRLKDTGAILDAVMWRGTLQRLGLKPEDGMDVIATGRVTTYAGRSTYQLVIEAVELAGEGALLKLIEERKKRLAAEGLFAESRKKPLPYLPETIGVVTSPTGAVIRDILHRLADRFPRRVLIWPVPVQGEGSAEKIAAAIRGFNALDAGGAVPRPDVLIVARGGGSLEDLMAFNEEVVVRAAAELAIPLISAVGHETDTTLIDYASDRRAPTPTAAAEIAVPVRRELIETVFDRAHRLLASMGRFLTEREEKVRNCARLLGEPGRLLEGPTQALDRSAERLRSALSVFIRREEAKFAGIAGGIRKATVETLMRHASANLDAVGKRFVREFDRAIAECARELAVLDQRFESVSYVSALRRGYAVIRDAAGHTIQSVAKAPPGSRVAIEFADGSVGATVEGKGTAPALKPPRKPGGGSSGSGSQGLLL